MEATLHSKLGLLIQGREYADFWVSAALGDTEKTVKICRQWGIVDQAASFFSQVVALLLAAGCSGALCFADPVPACSSWSGAAGQLGAALQWK